MGAGVVRQSREVDSRRVSRKSHDTISMVAIDKQGNIAAGSSTNGASHKVCLSAFKPSKACNL